MRLEAVTMAFYPEEGGIRLPRNGGTHLSNYTAKNTEKSIYFLM
jgi:hypothetical protein